MAPRLERWLIGIDQEFNGASTTCTGLKALTPRLEHWLNEANSTEFQLSNSIRPDHAWNPLAIASGGARETSLTAFAPYDCLIKTKHCDGPRGC